MAIARHGIRAGVLPRAALGGLRVRLLPGKKARERLFLNVPIAAELVADDVALPRQTRISRGRSRAGCERACGKVGCAVN